MRARALVLAALASAAVVLPAPAAAEEGACFVVAEGAACAFRCRALEQVVLLVGRGDAGWLQASVTCGTYGGACNLEVPHGGGFCLAAGFSLVDGWGHCRLGTGQGASCAARDAPPGLLTQALAAARDAPPST